MRKTIYSLLFIAVLIFVGACKLEDCLPGESPPAHADNAFVVCLKTGSGTYSPFLSDEFGPISAQDFHQTDYDCNHSGSPPQPKSSHPAYPVGVAPVPASARSPRIDPITGRAAYLARRILDLPLGPLAQISRAGACDPSQPDVLQVNHLNAKVVRIGTCPFRTIASIPTVTRPLQIDITPDGQTALVTSFDNAVNFIDLTSNQVSFTLKTDPTVNPDGIAITPDGTRAYITSFNTINPVVQMIDLATRKVTATIPASQYPQGAFMSPDGAHVWITYPLGGTVNVIDTLTNTDVTGLGIQGPYAVAFNSTGTRAYISSQSGASGTVQVVDTNTFQVIGSYTVGAGPVDVAVLYGDRFVVVNNNGANSISVIDLASGKVQTTSAGGTEPLGLSIVR
jgi:YVTN family beta-propeller protein